ncbi:transient receptor potential cation channel subfamily M member 3-like isoform X2 [Mytilus trossulus]|uniref:transient receptor potential cation channel subfamily M member 3-like isoform X2 n=1 Tax=Mytilus trossulus TaxID=6551 RepID=UPI003004719A
MVCCFATFVLTDCHPVSVKPPSSLEMFTLLWIFTVILEEMRQIWNHEQYSAWYKVQSWWGNAWNKFDAAMYLCFILAFILRLVCSVQNFWLAIMTYSISLAVFILRTLHFFYVAKYTGPKVIMIGKMVRDIQFFIMIFMVVLVSFGIITQANLFPNSELEWQLLKKIVYLPYWQLYGELFLDNMEGKEPSSCTTEVLLYNNGTLPRCPESNALVPLVLAIYMVFTNILLINLVIAMFSDTFQKVHANSVLVWKFYRYSLVYEYYERPFLIPPLIIINHLYRILQILIRKREFCTNRKCCKKIMTDSNAFQMESCSEAITDNPKNQSLKKSWIKS